MAKVYPLRVTVNAKGEMLPHKFAEEAASLVEKTDRITYEVTSGGLLLKGIWERDLELASNQINKGYGKELEFSKYSVEYIEGDPILEPIMNLELVSPEEHIGDVMGDINRRRGLLLASDVVEGGHMIKARVPLSELIGYCADLRRISPIEWIVNVDFCDYEPVPPSRGPDPNEPASSALRA